MLAELDWLGVELGAYVRPDYQENPDDADNLTNGRGNVRASGMSGQSSSRDSEGGWIEGEL